MDTKAEAGATQISILLVEDDEDDYLITEDLLSEIEGLKFDLEWAPDYDSALKEQSETASTTSISSTTGSEAAAG